jgi:ribosomal protein S18 acetylase RimI-like enzyme
MQIFELTVNEASKRLNGLVALLRDCVESGASVGFLAPLQPGEAEAYWASVADCLAEGSRVLLAALDGDLLVGCVQLDYATRPNASHRAEVMKLMVHTSARNRGIGRALMKQAAAVAARSGRTLLVLDTRSGDPSESLYTRLGYTTAGVIPGYARSASGQLHATTIMYQHLPPTATKLPGSGV